MKAHAAPRGALASLRVVEFSSIGPGPHCAMLLADMGADVVRIDRPGGNGWPNPVADRGRSILTLDIRSSPGRDACLAMLDVADVMIEGFRPGVMERLGLGPDVVCARNPRLVYGRMTGWGQKGPMAQMAGHDINYIALTGALAAMGVKRQPAAVPLNLVGDFGGGSMLLAFGILAALFERHESGKGQVIDAAIIDGVSHLMSFFAGLQSSGRISLERDRNLLAGAAPFYRTYLCADGREVSVGALEPQFFAQLIERLDLQEFSDAQDPARWDELRAALEQTFAGHEQSHWAALFEGSDACVVPVLPLNEAMLHPQLRERGTYQQSEGMMQVSAVPILSRTPGRPRKSEDTDVEAVTARWA